ncbi:hypothetical protein CPB84DRAFT_1777597 [Gymnopilus junonius]|uniref:Secreted protein n=1 Tax=Gymnopilus junonius TaxID=109634 RepID=A0A9P5NQH2_GYMJU|nr:hypothetical protein CPB84DRAFT_1777597 [Gymnopilus junonius]
MRWWFLIFFALDNPTDACPTTAETGPSPRGWTYQGRIPRTSTEHTVSVQRAIGLDRRYCHFGLPDRPLLLTYSQTAAQDGDQFVIISVKHPLFRFKKETLSMPIDVQHLPNQ